MKRILYLVLFFVMPFSFAIEYAGVEEIIMSMDNFLTEKYSKEAANAFREEVLKNSELVGNLENLNANNIVINYSKDLLKGQSVQIGSAAGTAGIIVCADSLLGKFYQKEISNEWTANSTFYFMYEKIKLLFGAYFVLSLVGNSIGLRSLPPKKILRKKNEDLSILIQEKIFTIAKEIMSKFEKKKTAFSVSDSSKDPLVL